MLCRLDDICAGVAYWKQESNDRQLAVSVGVSGVLQRSLGCHTGCTDVSVVGGHDG